MHEGQVVVPKHKVTSILQRLHKTNRHPGKEKLFYLFLPKFYNKLSPSGLRKTIDQLPHCAACILSKQNTASDRGLMGGLAIPQLFNTVVYIDFVKMDKFDGFDYLLVATCGHSRFTRAIPCTKRINEEEALQTFMQ